MKNKLTKHGTPAKTTGVGQYRGWGSFIQVRDSFGHWVSMAGLNPNTPKKEEKK